MTYHKLLDKQIKKYADDKLAGNDAFLRFIEAVNASYHAFERDKNLSEHTFEISQQEFDRINSELKKEVELRKLTIKKLKKTLKNLKTEGNELFEDNDGGMIEIIDLLNKEIAKRKEAEEQLLLSKEEAEKASKAKSEFLSIISHEIRTPLNAVIGMGHLLLKNDPRTDQVNNLKVLKTSADNLLVLMNDILDFNKIEAGKLDLEESAFSIQKLTADIITANTHNADERRNQILLDIDEQVPALFMGDALRLGQVLNNLVSNAVKFTQEGIINVKLNTLELTDEFADIHFSVQDTGVGIPAGKLASIFLPFTQASTSITRQYGGTGLGLAITKRILGLLNSDIKVKSEPGKGSEFSFVLRLKTVQDSEKEQIKANFVDYDLKNKNILLVEDTLFNVMYATQLLEDWNARVEVAENGAIAVEMLQRSACDLVLMDLQMPVMDGYTATTKIREFDKITPIIALTASATSNVREKVMEVGMQDYVTKPFNPDDFFVKLKKYLS